MSGLDQGGLNELMLTKFKTKDEKISAHKTYCFKTENPENPEYGWCRTGGNHDNQVDVIVNMKRQEGRLDVGLGIL